MVQKVAGQPAIRKLSLPTQQYTAESNLGKKRQQTERDWLCLSYAAKDTVDPHKFIDVNSSNGLRYMLPDIQPKFNGSNTFGTMKRYSRQE